MRFDGRVIPREVQDEVRAWGSSGQVLEQNYGEYLPS